MSDYKKHKAIIEGGRSVRFSDGTVVKTVDELAQMYPGADLRERRRDEEIEDLQSLINDKDANINGLLETITRANNTNGELIETLSASGKELEAKDARIAELEAKLAARADVPPEELQNVEVVEGGAVDLPNLLTEQPAKPEPAKSAKK